ncbi:DUF5916 domain-containing protein [Caldithrix abyssi]
MKRRFILLFLLLTVFNSWALAQGGRSLPDVLQAVKVNKPPKVDGILNEPCWQKAPKISNFTQRELNEGQPATEKTEVAVVYTAEALYIGVWCYDSEPQKIIAKEMKRDFFSRSEDSFEIVLDTYHDRRNGYLFVINPNGARRDVLIGDEGKQINLSWNGVWDVATKITEEGWFAEIEIPFSTLNFPDKDEQIWGINFERNIRRKNEQVLWQAWSRDYDIEMLSLAGKLVGLRGITNRTPWEFKPYATLGLQNERDTGFDNIAKFGGDVNYRITSNLKLNITVHTDFAQVEADRARINLTRFSLYYPEKRQFFLEGKSVFDFRVDRLAQVFYSRRIGLHEGEEIPIIGGLRLLGKEGGTSIGALSIQTAKKGDQPSTNYSVLRIKQDVLGQSYVGIIGTARNARDTSNYVGGVDFGYATSSFLGDKNLQFGAALAGSRTDGEKMEDNLGYKVYFSLPNDFIEYDLAYRVVEKNFSPEVGFLRRSNYRHLYTELQINPRPSFLPWVRKLEFKPLDVDYYWNNETGALESFEAEWRPLGIGPKSGDWFEYNIQRIFDRPTVAFELHDGVIIEPGNYWNTRHEIKFFSFGGRRLFVGNSTSWGGYYNGKRTSSFFMTRLNINRHLNLTADYAFNYLRFEEADFTTHEVGGRVEYAFNPKLITSLYGQWNNDDQEILLNFRLSWIPVIGSDFYFVINQVWDTSDSRVKLQDIAILSKIVWRFVR